MQDLITEMTYGKGAFRTVGKFIVHGNSEKGANMFAGTVIGKPEGADGKHQMWECEIIVIPRRKFTAGEHGQYSGERIDQLLCSNFGDRSNWEDGKGNLGVPYWEAQA